MSKRGSASESPPPESSQKRSRLEHGAVVAVHPTEVETLQKRLDAVLAALKDQSKAPEVIVAEALAATEQSTSAGEPAEDDGGTSGVRFQS